MTLTELEFSDELEELEEEAEEREMATFEHGIIATNISGELRNFLKGKALGRVADSSVEYRFLQEQKPSKGRKPFRQPDVSFVSQARLPRRFDDYPEIAPDLAVEVVSPNDKDMELEAKIALYQKYGVKLVWLVHPLSRTIGVYRLASRLLPEPVGETSELSGEELIPGFRLKLADIFDYPAPSDELEEAEAAL